MPQPDRSLRPPVTRVPVPDPYAFDELRFRHGFSRGGVWGLEDEPAIDVRDRPSTAGERSDESRRRAGSAGDTPGVEPLRRD
jgi:hypothetical protein